MRKITATQDVPPDDAGVTLSLSPERLKALGLRKPPATGATLQLRATATVARPPNADDAQDGAPGAEDGAPGGDDGADAAADAGAAAPALTLHLTGLTLTQPHKAPDKVLYGGGD